MHLKKTPIQQYFSGKNILITGSTGSCGRILLEKILRSLIDIGTIFLIIRSKRNLNAKQRVQKLLSTPLFSFNLIEKSQLQKIVVIEGNLTEDGISLSPEDRETLINNVQFVFHVAASVRFTATFRENFTSNVIATENVLKLANQFKKLECFIHVSTAYSNCQMQTIDEVLYPLPMDVHKMVEMFKSMDDKGLETECWKYFDGRPNNYTFTKAISEHVVNSYFPKLPVVIARPAVVLPCVKEPIPGFFDTLEGPTGLAVVGSLGILRVIDWNFNNRFENYPVDYMANSLIAIAYASRKKSDSIKIYNLVASPLNNYASDYEALNNGRKYWLESPSIYAIGEPLKPERINKMSKTEYKIKRFIRHTMLAFFLDLILLILGRKRMMLRVVRKMHAALDVMKYFSDRQWTFLCGNYKSLIDGMDEEDKSVFYIDIGEVDFNKLYNDSNGIARRYILKEDEKYIPIAKLKLKIQGAIFTAVKILVFYLLFSLMLSLTPIGQFFESAVSEIKNSMFQLINH